jgi:hypothetical protein
VGAVDDISFERLVNIQSYSDEELTELERALSEEERELSKRRRLLQGEIDILRAEKLRRLRDKTSAGGELVSDGNVDALTDILSGRRRSRGDDPGEK